MKQFEYKTEILMVTGLLFISSKRNRSALEEKLNQEGRRGWELCNIHYSWFTSNEALLTFKREKSEV